MPILTVEELREHVETPLGDDALQRLLDAAEEAIIARAGAPGARTVVFGGGFRFLSLPRPASAITSIVESSGDTSRTLVADDYELRPDGYLIERLNTGTYPRTYWWSTVEVTYTPVDDTATREEVQIGLVELAVTSKRGLTGQTIGSWSEQYANNAQWNAEAEREALLSRLNVSLGMVVVG